ncbi:hypothetical protein [Nostoc sp.]
MGRTDLLRDTGPIKDVGFKLWRSLSQVLGEKITGINGSFAPPL